jgi:hypothetical protein
LDAEHIADFDRDDPESLTRTFAYYMTLGIDGPGPPPDLLSLESLMNSAQASLAQAEWLKKKAIQESYQLIVGPDPIFTTTDPVGCFRLRCQGARSLLRARNP